MYMYDGMSLECGWLSAAAVHWMLYRHGSGICTNYIHLSKENGVKMLMRHLLSKARYSIADNRQNHHYGWMNAENVGQVCHPSTWEEEAGESWLKGILSHIKKFEASLGSMRPWCREKEQGPGRRLTWESTCHSSLSCSQMFIHLQLRECMHTKQ